MITSQIIPLNDECWAMIHAYKEKGKESKYTNF